MEMKKPKMILFDYGQTLVNEQLFDGVKGTEAVLGYATKNKYNKSAEEVQDYANKLNQELGRFDPEKRHLFQVEVPNYMFTKYLYESQGIEIPLSSEEIDSVFWDAAAPGKPTEGIREFLTFLKENHIPLAQENELEQALLDYKIQVLRKQRLLTCVMYQLIENSKRKYGSVKIGARRAFLFAKDCFSFS